MLEPGSVVYGLLPALMRSGSTWSSVGKGAHAEQAVFGLRLGVDAARCSWLPAWNADTEGDVECSEPPARCIRRIPCLSNMLFKLK
jgi:hypothetical protein